jgi:hypothetical protein
MPGRGPGVAHYTTSTKVVNHGDPTVEDHVAGVANKTAEQSWTLGLANRQQIAIGEGFIIEHKGQVPVRSALITTPAKGDPIYITEATNALVKTIGAGIVPFGRIVSLAGDNRGTPTGFVIIDMDARDTL